MGATFIGLLAFGRRCLPYPFCPDKFALASMGGKRKTRLSPCRLANGDDKLCIVQRLVSFLFPKQNDVGLVCFPLLHPYHQRLARLLPASAFHQCPKAQP